MTPTNQPDTRNYDFFKMAVMAVVVLVIIVLLVQANEAPPAAALLPAPLPTASDTSLPPLAATDTPASPAPPATPVDLPAAEQPSLPGPGGGTPLPFTPTSTSTMLPTPTASPTSTPTLTPTESPSPTPMATAPAIVTDVAAPAATNTAPAAASFVAVALLDPNDGDTRNGEVLFRWSLIGGSLPAGQAFELFIYKTGQDPLRDGLGLAAPTLGSSAQVNLDVLDADPSFPLETGTYFWSVRLVQQVTGRPVNVVADGRRLIYQPVQQPQPPTATPAPPATPTSVPVDTPVPVPTEVGGVP